MTRVRAAMSSISTVAASKGRRATGPKPSQIGLIRPTVARLTIIMGPELATTAPRRATSHALCHKLNGGATATRQPPLPGAVFLVWDTVAEERCPVALRNGRFREFCQMVAST